MTKTPRLFPFQLTPGVVYTMVTPDDVVVWGGRLCAKAETGTWLLFESNGRYAFVRFGEEFDHDARFVAADTDSGHLAPPSHDLKRAIPSLLKHFHTNDPGDAVFVVAECPMHRGSYTVTDYGKNRESITMDRQNTYILPANATMMRELLEAEDAVCTH